MLISVFCNCCMICVLVFFLPFSFLTFAFVVCCFLLITSFSSYVGPYSFRCSVVCLCCVYLWVSQNHKCDNFIATARTVCRAGSIQLSGVSVCLSVCLSVPAWATAARYRSIAAAVTCGGRMWAVPRCQRT